MYPAEELAGGRWRAVPEELRMIRSLRPAMLLLVVVLSLPLVASESAKSLYTEGKAAEAREQYQEAYDYYNQAFTLNPTHLRYRAARDRLRFLAGQSHVHRGQLMVGAGQLEGALA